jgi:hypothetical protein
MSVAVASLNAGSGFEFGGVWFHRDGDLLHCDVVSRRVHAANQEEMLALIRRAQDVLSTLRECSGEFSSAIEHLEPHFGVNDDGTMGSYPVVEMVDGQLAWLGKRPGAVAV